MLGAQTAKLFIQFKCGHSKMKAVCVHYIYNWSMFQ